MLIELLEKVFGNATNILKSYYVIVSFWGNFTEKTYQKSFC